MANDDRVAGRKRWGNRDSRGISKTKERSTHVVAGVLAEVVCWEAGKQEESLLGLMVIYTRAQS